ncbi:MAG: helix-turn-helix domain-containing protein [Terracidiphilus sp.]
MNVRRELDSLVTQMHSSGVGYEEAVREFKKQYVREVLLAHRGNQCKAAEEMGMHRNTLSRTMAELDLSVAEVRASLKRPVRSERPVFSAARQIYRQG